MSDNVQIALIVGVVFVIALWMFKGKLGSVLFSADKKGMKAEIHSQQNSGITISGVKQVGEGHEVSAETSNVTIEHIEQEGKGHSVKAITPSKNKK